MAEIKKLSVEKVLDKIRPLANAEQILDNRRTHRSITTGRRQRNDS
jgi:hypothetical protein